MAKVAASDIRIETLQTRMKSIPALVFALILSHGAGIDYNKIKINHSAEQNVILYQFYYKSEFYVIFD